MWDGKGHEGYLAPPMYMRTGSPEGCLLGVIHDGKAQPFYIGNGRTITAPNSGELLLTINDGLDGFSFGDNEGFLMVEVMVK